MSIAVTKASIEAIFKEVAPERIQTQIYRDFPLVKQFEPNERDIEIGDPSYARVPLMVGEVESVGARAFMGTLPDGSHAEYGTAKVRLAYLYGQVAVPGQWLKPKSSKAAFASYLTEQLDAVSVSAKRDMNRQIHGDGRGILAIATPGGPSATVTVDTTKHLRRRMKVDVIDRDTGVVTSAERTIVSVNPAGPSVTLDAAVTIPAGPAVTAIYRTGARNVELNGLAAAVSASDPALGPLQDVPVATVPEWAATEFDATTAGFGGAVSEELFQHVHGLIDQAVGGGYDKKLMVCPHVIRDRYATKLKTQQRFLNPMELKGGFKALSWNDNAFIVDKDTAAATVWLLDPEYIRMYRMGDWDFMDEDGSRLARDPNNRDAYIATLYKYCQIGWMKRGANARIYNVTA
jgi:hypothetical protein